MEASLLQVCRGAFEVCNHFSELVFQEVFIAEGGRLPLDLGSDLVGQKRGAMTGPRARG